MACFGGLAELGRRRGLKIRWFLPYGFESHILYHYTGVPYPRGRWSGDSMLLKQCNRCKRLIPYGSTYCTQCKPIMKELRGAVYRQRNKKAQGRYNAKRDKVYTAFYNSKDWRTLSRRYAQDRGYRCQICGAIATNVHHKTFIQTSEGWQRRLDYNNLQLLCTSCHNEKHQRFKARHTDQKNRKYNRPYKYGSEK